MNLIITIIVAALAIVGGLTLLEWLADKARVNRDTVNRQRRSTLTSIASVAGGALVGGFVWYENKRTKKTLHLLFELELLLAQLEGLVGVVLAQHDLTSMLPFMEAVVAKIGDYGSRAVGLMPHLEEELSSGEFAQLNEGTSMIISALAFARENPAGDPKGQDAGSLIKTIQKGVEISRTRVRELIDERI